LVAFYGNQWTRPPHKLQYHSLEPNSIALCLAIIFCGFCWKRKNGYMFALRHHAKFLKQWIEETFDIQLTAVPPASHKGRYLFGQARDFITVRHVN